LSSCQALTFLATTALFSSVLPSCLFHSVPWFRPLSVRSCFDVGESVDDILRRACLERGNVASESFIGYSSSNDCRIHPEALLVCCEPNLQVPFAHEPEITILLGQQS
jgi:hypothetical protein